MDSNIEIEGFYKSSIRITENPLASNSFDLDAKKIFHWLISQIPSGTFDKLQNLIRAYRTSIWNVLPITVEAFPFPEEIFEDPEFAEGAACLVDYRPRKTVPKHKAVPGQKGGAGLLIKSTGEVEPVGEPMININFIHQAWQNYMLKAATRLRDTLEKHLTEKIYSEISLLNLPSRSTEIRFPPLTPNDPTQKYKTVATDWGNIVVKPLQPITYPIHTCSYCNEPVEEHIKAQSNIEVYKCPQGSFVTEKAFSCKIQECKIGEKIKIKKPLDQYLSEQFAIQKAKQMEELLRMNIIPKEIITGETNG